MNLIYKYSITCLLIFVNSIFLFGQSKSLEWKEIQIPNLETALHKFVIRNDSIIGVDYGNGSVYRSFDLGATWEKPVKLPAEFFEKIISSEDGSLTICGDYGYVFRSNDFGATWTDLSPRIDQRITTTYDKELPKEQLPEGIFVAYYDMEFIDESRGYLSGYGYEPKVGFKSHRSLFFDTEDGGLSWNSTSKTKRKKLIAEREQNIEKDKVIFNNTFFFNKEIEWSLGVNEMGQNLAIKNDLNVSKRDSFIYSNKIEDFIVREIVFLDALVGFVIGGTLKENEEEGILFITKNGGKDWKKSIFPFPHIHFAQIYKNKIYLSCKEGKLYYLDCKGWTACK